MPVCPRGPRCLLVFPETAKQLLDQGEGAGGFKSRAKGRAAILILARAQYSLKEWLPDPHQFGAAAFDGK